MIIVMGLPGAGKTTVLTKAVEKHPEYKVLNYGTLMFDIAKRKHGVKERDEIRKLSAEQQKAIQAEVGKLLSKEDGKTILDTHCSILNPQKGFYLPGLPYDLLKNLKVQMLVLVTGDVAEIAQRRANDPTRTRAVDTKEISDHDSHNRMLLASYSVLSGAPCKVINNRSGRIEEAVKELTDLM